jgi:hypothetical protein
MSLATTLPVRRAFRRLARLSVVSAVLAAAVACTGANEQADDSEDSALAVGEWKSLWENVSRTARFFDGQWTNWYRHGRAVGIVKLGLIRMKSEKTLLHSAYPGNEKDGYQTGYHTWSCGEETKLARTYDGSCNAPENPGEGAAGTRFSHNVAPVQINAALDASLSKILGKDVNTASPDERSQAFEKYVMTPNPRDVSMKLLARRRDSNNKPVFIPFEATNLLGTTWVQFVIHDWYSHGDPTPNKVWSVPLSANDPLRAHVATLELPGTGSDTIRSEDQGLGLRWAAQNEVTHWFDGSQIYGSDPTTGASVREMRDGLMKVSSDGILPTGDKGVEVSGVTRNWWLGVSLLHGLFALEHNSVAKMLKSTYAEDPRTHRPWTDETLFQTARLITTALIAKIHVREFTLALTDHPTVDVADRANWNGLLNESMRARTGLKRQVQQLVDEFPIGGHPFSAIMFGEVGNNPYKAGVPQAMTEEFASTYRMHPVLPEELPILDATSGAVQRVVPLKDMRMGAAATLKRDVGVPNLFASFGVPPSGALRLHNFPAFLQDVDVYLYKDKVQLFDHLDVGTLEIIRDRERGLPRFNKLRELIGLKPFTTFEEFASPEDARDLREVYDSVDDVDIMTGIYAEKRHPAHPDNEDFDRPQRHFIYSETSFQLFMLMSSRRLSTDRFFTSSYGPDVYTQAGLDWIDCAGSCENGATAHEAMKRVLLRHFPNLASSGLQNVENAFRRWAPGGEPAEDRRNAREMIQPVAERPADRAP